MKIPKIKPPKECESGNAKQIDMRDLKKGIMQCAKDAEEYAINNGRKELTMKNKCLCNGTGWLWSPVRGWVKCSCK